ncbi:odorant receptor 83a-like [Schistocerca gregaria]|uniref:odorant receptor 83a-like n=1 Tax=Schistocerca gregaria TaxID=7010 RepID=UPI00211F0938|nr:odorant receptor 83a-like [Schistocerca gregaria]
MTLAADLKGHFHEHLSDVVQVVHSGDHLCMLDDSNACVGASVQVRRGLDLSTCKRILCWFSCWRAGSAWYGLYVVLARLSVAGVVASQLGLMPHVWGDLYSTSLCVYLTLAVLSAWFKMVQFYLARPKVDALLRELSGEVLLHAEDLSEDTEDVFRTTSRSRRFQKRSGMFRRAFLVLGHLTILSWAAKPFLDRLLGSGGLPSLPQDAWYPFDTTHSPYYEIAYLHQVLSLYVAATCVVTVDVFFTTLVMYLAAQLQVLNLHLRAMDERPQLAAATDKGGSYNNQVVAMKSEGADGLPSVNPRDAHAQLVRSVLHHQIIIRSVRIMEEAMGPCVFVQFLFNVIVMCIYAFVLAGVRNMNVGSLAICLTNLVSTCVENFGYCWFGNEIISQLLNGSYSFLAVLLQMNNSN